MVQNTRYEVPCLIVVATDDLDPYPHGNSHLHAGPTHTYIQSRGHLWHAILSGHSSLPFISLISPFEALKIIFLKSHAPHNFPNSF